MRNNLYSFETYKRIFDLEERRGRLKKDTFSNELQRLSAELKASRAKLKNARIGEKEALKSTIAEKKEEYEAKRIEDIKDIAEHIQEHDFQIELKKVNAKGKTGYTTANVESMLLSKVLMLELKRSYKVTLANRNNIIEELRALLDNPMPKIVIRTDIHHFFETIPQDKLIGKILEDSYLSSFTVKCLKTFLYKYNELSDGLETKVGIPRGLSFSSYLAEIYLASFDKRIRQLDGVYFYKRYVDDIVIIANPGKKDKDSYWRDVENEVKAMELTLNEEEEKRMCVEYSSVASESLTMNYLGYQFRYKDGKLDILLTEHRFDRYKDYIRLAFEKYREIGSCSSRKKTTKGKRMDTTLQFMHRLNALTGNGHLNSRKNYVLVGVYYSNKYLTDLAQLSELDEYMKKCLLDSELFCPSLKMFNYGDKDSYQKNVEAMREKILNEYSFIKGFRNRRMYRWSDYPLILCQLGNLYYSQIHND